MAKLRANPNFRESLRECCPLAEQKAAMLFASIVYGNEGIVASMLIHPLANVLLGEGGESPLQCACRNQHFHIAQRLLEEGADPHYNSLNSPVLAMAYALENAPLEFCEFLLEKLVQNPTEEVAKRACHILSVPGHPQTLQARAVVLAHQMWRKGEMSKSRTDDEYDFHLSASHLANEEEGFSEEEMLEIALVRYATESPGEHSDIRLPPPNAYCNIQHFVDIYFYTAPMQWTLLMVCIACRQYDLVREYAHLANLELNGAPPYMTPLQMSCWCGYMPIVESLLMAGADSNHTNKGHVLPLIYALEVGSIEMCRTLLEYGADPFHAPKEYTMTHPSAFNAACDILWGRPIHITSAKAMTAIEFAIQIVRTMGGTEGLTNERILVMVQEAYESGLPLKQELLQRFLQSP